MANAPGLERWVQSIDGCRPEVEKPGSLRSHGRASWAFQKQRKTVMLPDPRTQPECSSEVARQLGWERIAVDSIGKFRALEEFARAGGSKDRGALTAAKFGGFPASQVPFFPPRRTPKDPGFLDPRAPQRPKSPCGLSDCWGGDGAGAAQGHRGQSCPGHPRA